MVGNSVICTSSGTGGQSSQNEAKLQTIPNASSMSGELRAVADQEVGSVESGNVVLKCALCQLPAVGPVISCSGCSSSFHSDTLCLAISEDVLAVLSSNTDGFVVFRCCNCRYGKSGDRESPDGSSGLD